MPQAAAEPKFETKTYEAGEFKVLDDNQGVVKAIVSVTGVVDHVNDVIVPGAYKDTLSARRPKVCWGHDWKTPVGKVLAIEELLPGDMRLPPQLIANGAGALEATVQFNLATQRGREAYEDVKFWGPEGEWCVDETTEILTRRGWMTQDQVIEGDEAYVLDVDTMTARFEPILAINVFPAKSRHMRLIETGGHSSLTTAAHRWPVRQKVRDRYVMEWRTSADLTTASGLIRAAARSDGPAEAKWSDAFVELVAWYWTEGWNDGKRICIAQSDKNPDRVGAIRAALHAAFPGMWYESHSGGVTRFGLWHEASAALRSVTGPHKAPTAEFLTGLSVAQLRLLIDRCLDGDGHRAKSYERWYQVEEHSVRVFEMACALAGIPTNTYQPVDYGNRHGRTPMVVSLLRTKVAKPLDAIRVAAFQAKNRHAGPGVVGHHDVVIEHHGAVWCPSTPSGTWLARRNGTVYFTGNSIGYDTQSKAGGQTRTDPKSGVREIHKLALYEVSPVIFGAAPGTSTTSIKWLQTDTKRDFSTAKRRSAADSGAALPDGSFPIYTRADLANARRLVGRAKDPAAARRHIAKRARQLGLSAADDSKSFVVQLDRKVSLAELWERKVANGKPVTSKPPKMPPYAPAMSTSSGAGPSAPRPPAAPKPPSKPGLRTLNGAQPPAPERPKTPAPAKPKVSKQPGVTYSISKSDATDLVADYLDLLDAKGGPAAGSQSAHLRSLHAWLARHHGTPLTAGLPRGPLNLVESDYIPGKSPKPVLLSPERELPDELNPKVMGSELPLVADMVRRDAARRRKAPPATLKGDPVAEYMELKWGPAAGSPGAHKRTIRAWLTRHGGAAADRAVRFEESAVAMDRPEVDRKPHKPTGRELRLREEQANRDLASAVHDAAVQHRQANQTTRMQERRASEHMEASRVFAGRNDALDAYHAARKAGKDHVAAMDAARAVAKRK